MTPDLRHVAVACGSGLLVCLSLHDGCVQGCVDTGGDVQAAPVIDPWWGYVWLVTHGSEVVVVRPPSQLVARCVCGGSCVCVGGQVVASQGGGGRGCVWGEGQVNQLVNQQVNQWMNQWVNQQANQQVNRGA